MKEYKRFMVIYYSHYYPNGGLEDCKQSFDTLEEALTEVRPTNEQFDYTEYVFDRIEGKSIFKE